MERKRIFGVSVFLHQPQDVGVVGNGFIILIQSEKKVRQSGIWLQQLSCVFGKHLIVDATQAIARDILAEAMDRISAEDLNIVAHVHDEVIIEAPKDQYTVDEVCKLMSVNPAWCKGLPLAAAGYKGDYYFKD